MSEHTSALSRRAFIGTALAGTAALALSPATALAKPTAAEKQAEAENALNQLNAMQEKLDIASANYFTALDEQQQAQAKMDEAQARIDEASGQIDDLQGKLGSRARSMYRTGSATFLDLLLGATSFQAFTSNWDLLNDMNQDDADMVQQTKDLKAEVEAQKATYAEQERVAAEKAQEAAEVKAEAEALVDQMQTTYDNLTAEAAQLLAEEEAAREAAAAAAAREAEERARREAEAAAAAASRPSSNGGSNVNNSKPQTVTGNVVVDRAYSQLGKPYSWGAVGPNSFDCSGLVSYALTGSYSRLGTTYTFMGWTRVTNPQPGDVCTNDHHCGIYIGGGQMIHAPRTGDVVKVSGVHAGMIYVRY
ncbi:coiled-coil domain-containing protein [Adlercreutzia faecimuris]|uniref:NlpC/P60 family protein n=1 Tax=Adlercreutzia faecimuris TaxID=2897341 RepID=A0ABS9WI46_9ACTN|nr:NlpC/P60 family protein [Adlercreutzia sp. JBNU-10]MCI2242546.1 NlpC/P60 family protein [Adlercreutzia sp. JBNU-10]